MSDITKKKYYQNFIKTYNINPEDIDVANLPLDPNHYKKVVREAVTTKIQHWNRDCETRYSPVIPGMRKLELEFENIYNRKPSPEELGYMKRLVVENDLLKNLFAENTTEPYEWDPIKEFKKMNLL